jgi:hypothetical protein
MMLIKFECGNPKWLMAYLFVFITWIKYVLHLCGFKLYLFIFSLRFSMTKNGNITFIQVLSIN